MSLKITYLPTTGLFDDNNLERYNKTCFSCHKQSPFLSYSKCTGCSYMLCPQCMLGYAKEAEEGKPFKIDCPLCKNTPHSGIFPPIHMYRVGVTALTRLKRAMDLNKEAEDTMKGYKDVLLSLKDENIKLLAEIDHLKDTNALYTKRYSTMSESAARSAERIKNLEIVIDNLKSGKKDKRGPYKKKKKLVNSDKNVCNTCKRVKQEEGEEDCIYCTKICNLCSASSPLNDHYCQGCGACYCSICNVHYNVSVHHSCPFCTDTE